jgi:hypothetical protein
MTGFSSAWRWMFAALALGTSMFLLGVPAERWLPAGEQIPAIVIQVSAALNLVALLGVLLRKQWGYVVALVATLVTSAVASWTFYGYPKHTPQASFIAAWLICLTLQVLPGVRSLFISETK